MINNIEWAVHRRGAVKEEEEEAHTHTQLQINETMSRSTRNRHKSNFIAINQPIDFNLIKISG